MARTSTITLEQVAQIAQELQAQGITPGVRAVRERLGSGSNQTIQNLLMQWRSAQPAVAEAPIATAVAPTEGFMQALGQELQRVQAATAATYEAAVAEAIAARDTASNDALATYTENERLTSELEQRTSALHELQGRSAAQEAQLKALTQADAQRIAAERDAATLRAQLEMQAAALATAQKERESAEKKAEAAMAERAKLTEQATAERARAETKAAEQAKALTTAQTRADALEKQVAELQKLDALRISAEQRASKAETQVAMLEPRAKLVDGLQQQVAALTTSEKHLKATETGLRAQIEKLQDQSQPKPEKTAQQHGKAS